MLEKELMKKMVAKRLSYVQDFIYENLKPKDLVVEYFVDISKEKRVSFEKVLDQLEKDSIIEVDENILSDIEKDIFVYESINVIHDVIKRECIGKFYTCDCSGENFIREDREVFEKDSECVSEKIDALFFDEMFEYTKDSLNKLVKDIYFVKK